MNETGEELLRKWKGRRVIIHLAGSIHNLCKGVVVGLAALREGALLVRKDGMTIDLWFMPNELELIGDTEQPEKPEFTSDELYEAAKGDSLPTQWDEKALDTFLSLIGNCKEG